MNCETLGDISPSVNISAESIGWKAGLGATIPIKIWAVSTMLPIVKCLEELIFNVSVERLKF